MLIGILAFLSGILTAEVVSYSYDDTSNRLATTTWPLEIFTEDSNETDEYKNHEKLSPFDWVSEEQIVVSEKEIRILLENAAWSIFTDTNSMDPVIDKGANAIEVFPKSDDDIHKGDIVAYESDYATGVIVHRVIDKGQDENGTYYILKGDNNKRQDPGRIRFSQIRRVVVGIIY